MRLGSIVSRRRVWIVTGLSLVAAALMLARSWNRRAETIRVAEITGEARLVVGRASHDFGNVSPGEEVETAFQLSNAGASDLEISSVKPSCGCTSAELASPLLEPGADTTLRVVFSMPPHQGSVAHAVTLKTNDPQCPEFRFVLRAMSRWGVSAIPERLELGLLSLGQSLSREIELVTADGSDLTVLSAVPTQAWIGAERVGEPRGRRCRYRLTANAPDQVGGFTEAVEFTTSHPDRRTLSVEVHGEVVAAHKASPSRLILGRRARGACVSSSLVVQSAAPMDAAGITKVSIDQGNWDLVEWAARQVNDQTAIVTLSVKIPETAGYQRGIVHVEGPAMDQGLTIPIGCLVD